MGAKNNFCVTRIERLLLDMIFKSKLKATTLTSPDIRAGVSLLIAALSAKGISTIHNIETNRQRI